MERYSLFDLDNEIIDDLPLARGEHLKQLEKIIISDEHWKQLISLDLNEELAKHFFKESDTRESYFEFGVSCMLHFVQINFTGPEFKAEIAQYFENDMFKASKFTQYLSIDNEEINNNAQLPCLLAVAKLIFKTCDYEPVEKLQWWVRSTIIHQLILDELSATLWEEFQTIDKIIPTDVSLQGYERARFEIERAQLYLLFRNVSKAQPCITSASEILGVQYQLAGILGKRTKFQEQEKAQLALQTSLEQKSEINREPVKELAVPHNVSLNDDVRLETVQFTDDLDRTSFPNLEQQLLLVIVQEMIISKPQDELYFEELQPFVEFLLAQNSTWCVRTATLLLRCKLEAGQNRTIERSLQQCEEIVNSYKKEKPHPFNRLGAVYAIGLQPTWKTEAQCADLMFKLGLVKAALDVFLRLELWEEVIGCYSALNLKHKAAEIIKQQLEVKASVKLWCWLGDATDDETCYVKAWEMSGERSFRAQRHWGSYYYNKKQYKECIPHFETSVSINPVQQIVWLRLGFAALEAEDWQCAAKAYKYYTTLEPDNFEAWNNLAQAHIKLGNRRGAHQALLDALRCNYDNWKVWENLLVVSAGIYHLSDVIRSYHRLLDLKEKYLNIDILELLVRSITNNVNDPEGRPCRPLLPKCRELFGRVTGIYPSEGQVWQLYALIAPDKNTEAHMWQKAYRGFVKTNNWNKDATCCTKVLKVCHQLAEIVVGSNFNAKDPLVASVRMNLTSAISAIKKQDFPDIDQKLLADVVELQEKLTEKLKSALS